MRVRLLATMLATAAVLAFASACTSGNDCSGCKDVDVQVPWGATESHVYKLQVGGEDKGRTTLSIRTDGDNVVLTSRAEDDNGNSDESTVTVDAKTLKPALNEPNTDNPITNVHAVSDKDQVRAASSIYESGAGDCSTKLVVRIEQLVYKASALATAAASNATPTPESSRRSPLCIPEHAYDNDTSLFLWRAVPFEKGYHVVYRTILANRRDTQIIELTVHDKVNKTPLGDGEAWEVRLTADQINQRAWFSTDSSHKMLAYQNGGYLFLLDE